MALISAIMAGITNSKYELSSFLLDVGISVFNGTARHIVKKTQLYEINPKCNKNNPLMELETPRKEFQGFYRPEAKISMELEVLTSDKKIQPGSFKVSEKGIEFIKSWESYKKYLYDDGAGFMTVGYGHKILEGENFTSGLSNSEATSLLMSDIERVAIVPMNRSITSSLTQNQIDATASYIFNAGQDNTLGMNFGKQLNNGNFKAAMDEINIMISNSKYLRGLYNSRAAE